MTRPWRPPLIANDVRAARVAWTRFAPMVHRMLKRAFGSGQDTEDMVQDIFLCLFRKVGGLRGPKALKAFVIAITTTISSTKSAAAGAQLDPPFEGAGVVGPTPISPIPARQALVRFYAILNRLKAEDQAAFTLRFEGLELREVADALNISLATTEAPAGTHLEAGRNLRRSQSWTIHLFGPN